MILINLILLSSILVLAMGWSRDRDNDKPNLYYYNKAQPLRPYPPQYSYSPGGDPTLERNTYYQTRPTQSRQSQNYTDNNANVNTNQPRVYIER